jgi:hypothetical protein
MCLFRPVLVGLALALLACLVDPARGADEPPPARHALLVGIGDYESPRVPDLRGPVNDVLLMKRILETRFGFRTGDIRVLTNEAATRAAILAALKRLVASAGPRDVVYFHYSGHGSQTPDRSHDEADRKDETLVPRDGRLRDVPDITDDEIAEILGGLKTPHAVLVLDSCHSGTATRDVVVQARRLPPDDRTELYPKESGARDRAIVETLGQHYVLFTGAAENEQALDGPFGGRHHGFFTLALAHTVAASPPDASVRSLMKGVARDFRVFRARFGLMKMPEPQLEAPRGRLDLPLFPVAATAPEVEDPLPERARRPWLEVKPEAPGRHCLVGATWLGGLPGSVWAVHPPGSTEFRPGEVLARATVTTMRGADGLLATLPSGARIPEGSRAILVAEGPESGKIPVRILRADAITRRRLRKALTEKLPEVELVENEREFARFVVDFEGGRCSVSGATGDQLLESFPNRALESTVERLVRILGRSQSTVELVSLSNPGSGIVLEGQIVDGQGETGELVESRGLDLDRGIRVVPSVRNGAYVIRQDGDLRTPRNSLQLDLVADEDCYLTIVDVDAEGRLNLLFPNEFKNEGFLPEGRLRRNVRVRIPDSLKEPNRAGFHWDIWYPPGIDTIRVFATADLRMANLIRAYVRKAASGGTTVVTRSIRERQVTSLGDLREALIARGVKVVASRADDGAQATASDWTAITLTFEVRER